VGFFCFLLLWGSPWHLLVKSQIEMGHRVQHEGVIFEIPPFFSGALSYAFNQAFSFVYGCLAGRGIGHNRTRSAGG
jgi:hypothetical protein